MLWQILTFSRSLPLSYAIPLFLCLIFWPLSAICASATFGTSPPTRTCAKPGKPNQDALFGAVQLTRLSNCTLTLIFNACALYFPCCFPIKNEFAVTFEKTPWVSSVHNFGSLLHEILGLTFTRLSKSIFLRTK